MSEKDIDDEIQDAVTLALMQKEIESLKNKVSSLEKDRDSALRWGILVLGSSVLSMGVWIFKLLTAKIPL